MNKYIGIFVLLNLMPLLAAGQSELLYEAETFNYNNTKLPYRILYPPAFEEGKKYPLLLFLHGAGERGADNKKQLMHGSDLFTQKPNRQRFPSIVVFPQCAEGDYWASVERTFNQDGSRQFEFDAKRPPTAAMSSVLALMDSLISLDIVDRDRVYVGGLSMGGMGTFEIAYRRPEWFASAFAICGGGDLAMAETYADKVPFWIFHGEEDAVVPPHFSKDMAEQIRKDGGEVKLTLYEHMNHNSWDSAFIEPGLLSWVYSHQKGNRSIRRQTYCNPVDIDYSYMSHYAFRGVSYRSGADPAVINYKGRYVMFVTRSHGYWYSDDMGKWIFVKPQSWYFNGSNAPAAAVYKGRVIVLGDPSGQGAVITTDNPELGDWETTYSVIPISIQDPDLFVDEDDRVYLYEESSNKWPIRGVELDAENMFIPTSDEVDLFNLNPDLHGWERFGKDHSSDITPFIEGPWMTRHGDTYYLEYSAPGTQWNVYADGVYTSKHPLGPFEYAPYNPVSYKPGGFLTGAGHGSTVQDNHGNYWHFASMAISVNYKFERRIGMFPAGFENDGQMYVNTAYGDYPHYLPDEHLEDHKNRFTGWMLLSRNKSIMANSTIRGVEHIIFDQEEEGYMPANEQAVYIPEMANDENMRTLWVAGNNSDSLVLEVDLGRPMTVYALQINFQDFNARVFGKPDSLRQQFIIETSMDGEHWEPAIDMSQNHEDRPNAYLELNTPVEARHVRYRNVYFPNKYLAIAEFRVFGKGNGPLPGTPKGFEAVRQDDRRNASINWKPVKDAMGYVLYWGIHPDRLNNSVMIYGQNSYELRALNSDQKYYFTLEAFNENGVSARTKILSNE